MRDKISEQRIAKLHPLVRETFRSFVEDIEKEFNITIRVTQGLRTFAEQQALYDQGRTKPGKKVTNAKPGQSYHNYGLAIDIVPIEGNKANWNYKFSNFKNAARKHGLVWGGDFKSIVDKPHFEKTFGLNWRDLLKKYEEKQFIEQPYVKI